MSENVVETLQTYADNLREMGEDVGANALERRVATLTRAATRALTPKELEPVELSYEGDKIVLKTPLIPNRSKFWAMYHKLKDIDGREWDGEEKVTRFPKAQEATVTAIVADFFAGHTLNGPEGSVELPAA